MDLLAFQEPRIALMMNTVVAQMTPLTHRLQILVSAIFRLVVEMRHR
jgi:hypothetical protein